MSLAVKISHLSKSFSIPSEKQDSLRECFSHLKFKKTYQRLTVLKDINFEFKTGQWLGIIGPNGSGKSTLLKLIAGIYEPDKGTIDINGRLVPFLELGVGFNPDLSARDNIFLNGVILGMKRKKIQQKFNTIVNFAGVKPFIHQKLKNFSTGMQVRLGFSIAFQTSGDIYLLDEILAVGDYQFQQKSQAVFQTMKRQGKSVILVSHDLDSIEAFCDQVIWLEKGEIKAVGSPGKVLKQYLKK